MAKSNVRAYKKQKARQASQVSKIHRALVVAGFDTVAKQAAVLGLSRSAAWAFLHQDKRAGPSNMLLKRILLSKLPRSVRAAIHQYIEDKGLGLYGHSDSALRDHRRSFVGISHSASPDDLNEKELEDLMNSLVVKHSIAIHGHKTSVSLEEGFWIELKKIAHARRIRPSELVTRIDRGRQGDLSSAIRLFVLQHSRIEDKQMEVAKARLSTLGAEGRPAS